MSARPGLRQPIVMVWEVIKIGIGSGQIHRLISGAEEGRGFGRIPDNQEAAGSDTSLSESLMKETAIFGYFITLTPMPQPADFLGGVRCKAPRSDE